MLKAIIAILGILGFFYRQSIISQIKEIDKFESNFSNRTEGGYFLPHKVEQHEINQELLKYLLPRRKACNWGMVLLIALFLIS